MRTFFVIWDHLLVASVVLSLLAIPSWQDDWIYFVASAVILLIRLSLNGAHDTSG